MQTISFEEALEHLLVKDQRYHRDAYLFVRDSLDHTRKLMDREHKETRIAKRPLPTDEQHVTGQQLLSGVRELALQTYGPMVIAVFEAWGIRSCEDFGEIVFIMVEYKLLKKTDNDSQAHFENGYDFHEAFRKPFLPPGKIAPRAEPSKEAKA